MSRPFNTRHLAGETFFSFDLGDESSEQPLSLPKCSNQERWWWWKFMESQRVEKHGKHSKKKVQYGEKSVESYWCGYSIVNHIINRWHMPLVITVDELISVNLGNSNEMYASTIFPFWKMLFINHPWKCLDVASFLEMMFDELSMFGFKLRTLESLSLFHRIIEVDFEVMRSTDVFEDSFQF